MSLSLRAYIVLLVLAVSAPPVALAAYLAMAAHAPWWAWLLCAALLVGAFGLAWLAGGHLIALVSSITRSAASVAHGEVPQVEPVSIREVDELARGVEQAGVSRRDAEGELRGRNERLTTILGSTADALVVLDDARRIVLFNHAAETIFARASADVIGHSIDAFVSPPLRELLERHRDGVSPGAAPADAGDAAGHVSLVRPDGAQVPVEPAIARITLGATTLCALTLRDITERRRAEGERTARLSREEAARSAAEVAARHAQLLAEATRLLNASPDPAAALAGLAQSMVGSVAAWCVVDLLEEDGTLRRVRIAHAGARGDDAMPGPREYPVTASELVSKALAAGQPHLIADATEADLDRLTDDADEGRLLRRLGVRSLIVAPLMSRGDSRGAITLARSAGPAYAEGDVTLATDLAHRVAIALDRGRLYRRAHDAHARVDGLVEGLNAIVWEADPATLEITFVNHRVESLLGYTPQRWLAEPQFWLGLIHADDRDAALARLRECGRTGRECRLEYRVRTADERMVWLDTVVRTAGQPDGGVVRLYGLTIDAGERKRLEEERDRLLVSEQGARAEAEAAARRSRFLAEASDLLVSSLDYEATLHSLARLAVPTFADWCLVQLEDGHGGRRVHAACADAERAGIATALESLAPSVNMTSLAPILELFQRGGPLVVPEVDAAWLDTLRLVEALGPRSIMVVPLIARDRPLGSLTFISTGHDRRYGPADLALAKDLAQRAAVAVDNARLYREAGEANRAKDEFMATVSHELRTPLTAMLGWVHMLRSGRLGVDETKHALASIDRNTRAQARLIDDLLDMSRVVAGKLPVEMRPLDLRSVIEHAVESVSQNAADRGLTLACALDVPSAWVLGDAVRLEQVTLNLLGNAVKFTPSGGRIDLGLEREQGMAKVTVSDTGQGIEAELLPHVFDSFRQAETGSTRRHGGLGLGLAIVRHLVGLHDGRVEARSPGRGKGATFTVYLPLLAGSPPAEAAEVERRSPVADARLPRLDAVRALVVDDHEDTRHLVKAVLVSCGATVELAPSVDDAVEVLRRTPIDIVVCDIEMPGSDGYALIAPLRDIERQQGRQIRVIALTAYASEHDRARALAAGFDAHVAKPMSPTDLASAVGRAAARP